MASCKKQTKKVTKLVEVDEDEFVLTLSKREAAVLKILTGNITGCSKTTPRKYTDDIYFALNITIPNLYNYINITFKDSLKEFEKQF